MGADVGKSCSQHTINNKVTNMAKAKGFGKVPQSILICEVAVINFPSKQQITGYRAGKKFFSDFEELLKIYGVDRNEPELQMLQVTVIRPRGSHPETGLRSGVIIRQVIKILTIATEKGSLEGRVWASIDLDSFTNQGIRDLGISHAAVEDGRITPVTQNGKKLDQFAIALNELDLGFLDVFNNQHPFFGVMTEKLGVNFYSEIARVAARRVRNLKTNDEITFYIGSLFHGLAERNPQIQKTGYLKALWNWLLDDFSDDRKQIIWGKLESGKYQGSQDDILMMLFDDLLAAFGRFAADVVTGPNQSERVLVKDDLVLLDQVWQGASRFTVMIEAFDRMQQNQKDSETDNTD